ncbi:MAG: hypothetical protein WCL54_05100 [Clostridia bacterium]
MKKEDKVFKPISFLPQKQRREIFIVKILRVVLTFTALILTIAAIFFVSTPLLNLSKNQEITKVDTEIALIREQIKGMQKYEEVFSLNKTFHDVLINAMGTGPAWDKILTTLIQSKPITIQVQSIEQLVAAPALITRDEAAAAANSVAKIEEGPKNLLIKCLVTNLNDFDYWLKVIQANTSLFTEVTPGKFEGNQYGYLVDITVTIPVSGPYEIANEEAIK